MVVDSSKSDSISSLVRAVLVKAWRERWNEIRWGVCLKRVLASCPEENCDLAGQLMLLNVYFPFLHLLWFCVFFLL